MPVVRRYFRGCGARYRSSAKFPKSNVKQGANPAKQVNGMRHRKYVEKRRALADAAVNSSGNQLPPRNDLPQHKRHSQCRSEQPQILEATLVPRAKVFTRRFQCAAAA